MKTILIVDDLEANVYTVTFAVKTAGYATMKAQNGFEALEILRTNKIDLVISDYKMPEMSGLEFLKRMRHDDNIPAGIPFIFLSTVKEPGIIAEAEKEGAFAWVYKPYVIGEFLNTIKEAVK